MKPRNKREKLVAELSSRLPAITEAQVRWGKKHCFPHNAYRCKDEMWCSECGRRWIDVTGQKDGYIQCPYCGERIAIKSSRKKRFCQYEYMTILTVVNEFQVLRHVEISKYRNIKTEEMFYHAEEVCQQWITEDLKETVMAKPMNMGRNAWIYTQPISIKNNYDYYGYKCYDLYGKIYPKVNLLPILRRNGLRTSFHNITPAVLIRSLLGEREYAEMLLKTHQYKMLEFYLHRGKLSHPWAVNICNRNGYIIRDGSMYDDYLHLLDYFHLDTHNAKYVCPKSLKKEHDRLMEKKSIKEEKIRKKKRIEEARKWEDTYMEQKGRFFGICFGNDNIVISVISSVAEMAEEGEKMHHCVYSMGYYKKKNSLILSAKDRNGNRIETIELSLKTFQVVQSRGVCNSNTDKHNEILDLVQKNINLIKQAA